ncbi:MAG: Na+/H+ antiporter subunit E [Synechococcus sp.]
MIKYLNYLLRIAIWFLLTADVSLANIIIGITVTLLIPTGFAASSKLKDWLRALYEVAIAVPQAYWETLVIMFQPHKHEDIVLQRVRPRRTPGLIFLDIFIITFTPKTIVLKYHNDGWYEVHQIKEDEG